MTINPILLYNFFVDDLYRQRQSPEFFDNLYAGMFFLSVKFVNPYSVRSQEDNEAKQPFKRCSLKLNLKVGK